MSSFTKILPFVLVFLMVGHANAQLRSDFYKKSCGNVFDLVRPVLEEAVRKEARMAASILRLHFHDCFVNGCDGSILLDDTSSFTGEKSAGPNQNSARGFEVIDAIKTAVEKACPGVVSCADILTIAARDSVVLSNGPSWEVKLGRRDSTTASLDDANRNIPVPSSSVNQLISRFRAQGLSARDMVALSGAHTIGKARCTTFRDRIYNETTINERYAKFVSRRCPASGGDDNLSPLDVGSATRFDNGYFQNLKCEKGLLHSDQVLQSGGSSTASIVDAYSNNPSAFYKDFIQAMIKMGNNKPLTGYDGQIRRNCRIVN